MSDFTTLDRMATSQHGLLTRNQLLACGLSVHQIRHRVESGQLRRRGRGVYALPGTAPSWHQQLHAAVLAGGALCAASHRSASRLWQMRSVDDDIDVSIRYPADIIIPNAVMHRSRDLVESDITWVEGIATTTPDRTICDLGLRFPQKEVSRILRHSVATGLVNQADALRIRTRNSRQGRNGVGILGYALDALPAFAELAESGAEVLFLGLCDRFQIPRPVMQLPVIAGGRLFRLDFAYPLSRVFIEIDGAAYHSSPDQIANDDGCQNALVAAGWTPLRFTFAQIVDHPFDVATTIRRSQDL